MVSGSIVFAWGAGEDGQLGLGDLSEQHLLQPITTLEGLHIAALVGGSRNSLVVTADGKLYTWGWNQRGTLGHPQEAKVECVPRQVAALAGVKIVQAAIGGWHCLAVDDQGQAYAWGGNEYGQCGQPVEKNWSGKIVLRDIPTPQPCATHLHVKQVAAGGTHSMVLTMDGEVWTWGQPWPPGDSTNIWLPVKVQGLSDVKQIAVGAFHNLALLSDGKVVAWGNNEYAQLGVGDTQPRSIPEVVRELTGKNVVDVSAGGWHSVAITSSGEVYSWGRGEHGRLGFGDDKSTKMTPHRIELLTDKKCVQMATVQVGCGGTHSLLLTEDGRLFSFGRGDHGRLGLGHKVTSGHPLEVHLAHLDESSDTARSATHRWRVEKVACGGRHNLALLRREKIDTPPHLPTVSIQESLPTKHVNIKDEVTQSVHCVSGGGGGDLNWEDSAEQESGSLPSVPPEVERLEGVVAGREDDGLDLAAPLARIGGSDEVSGTGDRHIATPPPKVLEEKNIFVVDVDHVDSKGEKFGMRVDQLDGSCAKSRDEAAGIDVDLLGKGGG